MASFTQLAASKSSGGYLEGWIRTLSADYEYPIKLLIKVLLLLLASILFGFWFAQPAIAESPTISNQIINPPYGPKPPEKIQPNNPSVPSPKPIPASRQHSTRAENQVSGLMLREWLLSKGSPLAPYSEQILQSSHWSTIIGICWIEQHHCTRLPGGKNWNLWGIGGASGLRYYSTAEEGIQAISELLAKYESKGKDTIEELNGYYVVPASENWYRTVLNIKQQVENL